MGKCVLGIDIGAGSIKLVELERVSGGVQLLRAKLLDLTGYSDQEKRESLIREGLEKILRSERIRGGKVAISLSGQSVFIRFLKLPKVQKGKIDKIIKYEVQQQVPFPLEKIIWDHQIFHSSEASEEDILFVAAKKDIVEATLGYFSGTNLSVELVDTSPLSLFNAITFNEPLTRGIILDIGAKTTNLIIMGEDDFWVRSILIAGDEMTRAIASRFKISFEEAEELKKREGMVLTGGFNPPDLTPAGKDIAGILNPILTDLAESVEQSIEFYRAKYGHEITVNEAILAGGSSQLKGIEDFLAKNLTMQIRRANLAHKIKCPSALRVDIDFQTRYGAAIGLGLRLLNRCPANIDLLPQERKIERDFRKDKLYIMLSGLLFALIPLTLAFNISYQSKAFKSEVKSLNGLLSKYEFEKNKISTLKDEIKKIEAKIQPFKSVTAERPVMLETLLEVEKLLPSGIWITSFELKEGSVGLKGQTTSNLLAIKELKNKLESSSLIGSVEILYASLPKQSSEDETQIRDFSIRFKLKGLPEGQAVNLNAERKK
ncbi:MAG: pilus assembly protein PilM [Candidatus Omnitrophota bacterium]